ncbi:MAG: DUF4139 domain-containing protein [Bacteroidales bacterium]|jgi:TonB-dependent SusC/RagA subfamily outer membrane receptor|nr:DUF4139 domain-containing protein [Bacteroidales bacterium]
MKKTVLIAAACFVAISVYSQNIKMTAKRATVYFSGAELTHSAQITLSQGANEVIFEGLTPNIDLNSLKINATNSVVVASSEFTTDYLTERKSADLVKRLQDSIDISTAALGQRTTAIRINTSALELLRKAIETNFGGVVKSSQPAVQQVLPVAEMTQQLDFYTTKAQTIEKTIAADKKQSDELNKTLSRLQKQLNQEQSKRGVYNGVLKLQLMASFATPSTITVSYFTQAARWTPIYDMIISDVSKPVQLKGRARVSQNTGIDWNTVAITLSSATPARSKDAPVFSPWFIDFVSTAALTGRGTVNIGVKNSVSYDSDAGVMYDMERSDKIGLASPAARAQTPLYIIDGVPFDEMPNIDPSLIQSTEILKSAEAANLYGARAAGGVIIITTKTMEDFVTAEEKISAMEFSIDMPYTIPGNGKEQLIDLKTYELAAEYKYYAAPKLDENVFLIADFRNWEKLNILPGMANITYDGTFVGQTFLNTAQTQKILSVTLGTEKRVQVKREKLTDFSHVRTFGGNTTVTLAYKITVKNNLNRTVQFTLKEPYPISQQNDIRVTLNEKETTPPTVNNAETGVVTWNFELPAAASKEFRISYEVRYPKDRKINLR